MISLRYIFFVIPSACLDHPKSCYIQLVECIILRVCLSDEVTAEVMPL